MRKKKKVDGDKPKKPKKKSPYNQNSAVRSALRRAFSRSPVVREVLMEGRREIPKYNKDGNRAKRDAVQYLCHVCGEWVGSTKVNVDHIDPVVDPNVCFVDWNTFIDRLWCDKSNLQRICLSCHNVKCNLEKELRKQTKQKKDK